MFLGLLACSAGHAQAELYKWTDGQGKTHYSDQPPTANTQSIGGAAASQAEITSEAKKALNEKDQAYQKRKKDADEARAKADAEAEQARIKRENCDRARKNLSVLESRPRVYSTDAAGRRVYMDDAARASALASSQQAVEKNCK
ncbi:MAG: DUF4124 domain-containing protein [Gammaproteobacteria bacterium]